MAVNHWIAGGPNHGTRLDVEDEQGTICHGTEQLNFHCGFQSTLADLNSVRIFVPAALSKEERAAALGRLMAEMGYLVLARPPA